MATHTDNQPMASTPQTVTGTVESIIFRNDETGYTVCSIKPAGATHPQADFITLVGNCAAIWEGEELMAEGEWNRHPTHGHQFQAKSITCVTPTSAEGIRRYLASGMIKGIGPKFAQRIVERFGERTLEIIDRESGRLREVSGIGEGRRKLIKESWIEQSGIRHIMIFLQSHGIGTAKASRIFRQYGTDSIAVVKRNPYRLCAEVWGIGFKTADAIALSVGIAHNSEIRARAGLIYTLQTEAGEGHCYTPEPQLLLHAQDLLEIPMETLALALNAKIEKGRLIKEEDRIYLRDIYRAEVRIARRLQALLQTQRQFPPIDADKAIRWAETKIGITLATKQVMALSNAIRSKVSIITGGPGVGKTTIIRALTEIFKVRKLNIQLAAPTGRAAKRLAESTAMEALTIHRLLKFNPNVGHFEHDEDNPLTGDVFILDESSMIDINLIDDFLRALPLSATLIIVGDTDQLPSVGPGNVLRDLIASNVIPCCSLDTIFRQDSRGLIVRNAHNVNHGKSFATQPGDSDFYFIETNEPEKIIARAIELMTERIPRKFGLDPLQDVQILSPMRRNLLGTENLNDVIQAALNPSGPALVRGCTHFRPHDRVMQLRNNYDKDVFNGDIGFIAKVFPEEQSMIVLFEGRPVKYQQNELDELVLAYACSIHKSQGSEYPAVIVLMHTQHYKLLQRNLLYTAITRGKRLVLVVGSSRAINIAIKANQVRERRTSLKTRLETDAPYAAPPT